MAVGAALVVVVVVVGAVVADRTAGGPVDRWFLEPRCPASAGRWFTSVTWLRYPAVTVAGSVVAAAVVFRRDLPGGGLPRSARPLALLTSELVLKPAVGRTLGGVYSYPSGSTVGAAALATVAVLAVPPRWRTATLVVAVVFALWMSVAVVSLRWHYPTDALAGLAYGVGVVLVADGAAWKVGLAGHRVGATAPRGSPACRQRGLRPELPPAVHRPTDDGHGVCRAVGVEVEVDGLVRIVGLAPGLDHERDSFFWGWRASLSPTAMPVMTAPVAERFIQLLKRSGSFPSPISPVSASTPAVGRGPVVHRRVVAGPSAGFAPRGGGPSGAAEEWCVPSSAGSGLGLVSTLPR